jgi:hypothetical protein
MQYADLRTGSIHLNPSSHTWLCRASLVWNAMFAAFNVSARNLYYFVDEEMGTM